MDKNEKSPPPKWRTNAALILFLCFSIFGILQGILHYEPFNVVSYLRQGKDLPADEVSRTERKMRCLENQIPAGQVVGLISDLSGTEYTRLLREVQYAASPGLVTDSQAEHYVIAIFVNEKIDLPETMANFEPILECNGSLTLYHRVREP